MRRTKSELERINRQERRVLWWFGAAFAVFLAAAFAIPILYMGIVGARYAMTGELPPPYVFSGLFWVWIATCCAAALTGRIWGS